MLKTRKLEAVDVEAVVVDGESPALASSEVVVRARRRRFTAEFKARVLREADRCKASGEIGALLRREGLYASHLITWRRQRETEGVGGLSRKRGRKVDPEAGAARKIAQLERANDVDANREVFETHPYVAGGVTLSGRLFELTRHTQPAGVHVPVVREGEFFTRPSRFVGIPRDDSSRVAIRVYDPQRRPGGVVRLELFGPDNVLIDGMVMPLLYTVSDTEPGYAAILDLTATFPRLNAADRFDIQITPLTTGMEYWALASVTDRDTQQVLFITAD